ncbi:ROK family protein [Yoonia sp. SS1-5]|uniref:N-acetylglucosamine kinase n=1 Tax=Yoonia rhodophyticola TaxID=3137370 RepID=A0AAN0M9U3_9RHOB
MICGGIDLGGTKIEARIFEGPAANTAQVQRIPTPTTSFDAMLDGLSEQIDWLVASSASPEMPIGIAVPGIVDPETGIVFAANIPTDPKRSIAADLAQRHNRPFALVNDCMAFTLSEADGGAAGAYQTVMGLILGTGVGGGFAINRALAPRHGAIAVEIGHVGIPAAAIARHDLPLWPCGCGRLGCMETCVSGTGLSNIAAHKLGQRLDAMDLVAGGHHDIIDIWADIAGECLLTIQLTLAPDCIVLGGGVSNLPGITARLSAAMKSHALGDMPLPDIVLARHGDSSGARGAALVAARQ